MGMPDILLHRNPLEPKQPAVLGRLTLVGAPPIFTLERLGPDGKPLVPAGVYDFIPHGWDPGSMASVDHVWEITKVPGHEGILLHAGNWVSNTKGCVLCGLGIGDGGLKGPMITRSQDALTIMRQILGSKGGKITITDAA